VTKTFSFEAIQSAKDHNLYIIGENRVQETLNKLSGNTLSDNLEVHLIGHLQSNKVNKAVQIFDVIQTVDSLKIAQKINNAAKQINKTQNVYMQINVGKDSNKYGFHSEDVIDAAKSIDSLSNIHLTGIMMIPPLIDIDDNYRNIFQKTKLLQLEIYNSGIKNCINISMGMSRDYSIAIEEGATHIRIGTALFGDRN